MRTSYECISCLVNQLQFISEVVTNDRELRERIVREALRILSDIDMDKPPPYAAQQIHRVVREISGNPDPYKFFKDHFTRLALKVYPYVRNIVRRSDDPFRTAVLVSLAGNVIDYAPGREIKLFDTINEMLAGTPAIDQIADLKSVVENARSILYIGDNAGETVMDRLLIEQLPSEANVIYAVRGGGILNDATFDDAVAAGIDKVADIMSTGSDAPGIILEDCTEVFRRTYWDADCVVAKGMGNFETLSDPKRKDVFFLLLVKCDLVGQQIGGCTTGDAVVIRRNGKEIGWPRSLHGHRTSHIGITGDAVVESCEEKPLDFMAANRFIRI